MALILCPDCQREHSDAAPACPGCGRPTSVVAPPTFSRAYPESNLAGQVLAGKYQLDCMVGRGGMASVYKATRLDLQMPVAVKIISPQVAEEQDFSERFIREARIQFLLQHRGIVRVFDLIREHGWLGLAMDWIEGENLLQFLKKRTAPLTPTQLMDLMFPILDALSYAHQQDVIHRDIKPGNILLQVQGQGFSPKLTDFGIAKMAGDDHQTLSHVSLGTPTYMSPEQIEGAKDVDLRTDIYSMGVLLFRMVTGKAPFKGPTAMATSMAHLRDPIPTVQSKFEGADPRFDSIIQTAMAKLPEERFPNCAAFAQALKLALNDDRPLLPSLQKVASSSATNVDLDMNWMSSFAGGQQKPKPQEGAFGLIAMNQPPTGVPIIDPDFEEELGKTEVSGPQSRQRWQAIQALDADQQTGAHPTHIAAEDAQGSTGELIRKAAYDDDVVSLGYGGKGKWFALFAVAALCLIGGWWLLRSDPPASPKSARRPAPVQLSLTSVPGSATVFDSGKALGKTPLTLLRPHPGQVMALVLKLDGYEDQPIQVSAQSPLQIKAVMRRLVRLKVTSKPVGARVSVDGVLLGVTPMTVKRPRNGRHVIQLKKEGFVPKTFSWHAAKDGQQLFHLAPKIW